LIHAPGRDQKVLPFDHVGIIATDDQLQTFMPAFNAAEPTAGAKISIEDISLEKIVIDEHTRLRGLTLRDSGIRENSNFLVVGIERDGKRILNPDSNTIFEWDDIVWLVGDRKLIANLREG
ncbi:MAG TPA: TrkA C-terminal domain-containing protein, partial [Anseongella sp.]|nr:TrkA C-terminal domain-containing protein [Anseongella sp.]